MLTKLIYNTKIDKEHMMNFKYFFTVALFFVLTNSPLNAQENITKQNSIKTLIQKVKKAPPSQRRVLMNKLKIELRAMNQETRKQTMIELRNSFNKQHTNHNIKQKQNMHKQHSQMMNKYKDMHQNMKDMKENINHNMDNMPNQMPMKKGM